MDNLSAVCRSDSCWSHQWRPDEDAAWCSVQSECCSSHSPTWRLAV